MKSCLTIENCAVCHVHSQGLYYATREDYVNSRGTTFENSLNINACQHARPPPTPPPPPPRVCKWDTPGLWNIDPEELRGWQQNAIFTLKPLYSWRIYRLLLVHWIQVPKCRMTRPRNSAHQCLVTKINVTILNLIRNPIFKEQSFECIGNFGRLISTC